MGGETGSLVGGATGSLVGVATGSLVGGATASLFGGETASLLVSIDGCLGASSLLGASGTLEEYMQEAVQAHTYNIH